MHDLNKLLKEIEAETVLDQDGTRVIHFDILESLLKNSLSTSCTKRYGNITTFCSDDGFDAFPNRYEDK